jgi:hypothetical protein
VSAEEAQEIRLERLAFLRQEVALLTKPKIRKGGKNVDAEPHILSCAYLRLGEGVKGRRDFSGPILVEVPQVPRLCASA